MKISGLTPETEEIDLGLDNELEVDLGLEDTLDLVDEHYLSPEEEMKEIEAAAQKYRHEQIKAAKFKAYDKNGVYNVDLELTDGKKITLSSLKGKAARELDRKVSLSEGKAGNLDTLFMSLCYMISKWGDAPRVTMDQLDELGDEDQLRLAEGYKRVQTKFYNR